MAADAILAYSRTKEVSKWSAIAGLDAFGWLPPLSSQGSPLSGWHWSVTRKSKATTRGARFSYSTSLRQPRANGAPRAFPYPLTASRNEPRWLGPHGLRFVSVHVSKRQTAVVTYARGTGPVWVPLTPGAKRVKVDVVKGLDYLPVSLEADVTEDPVRITAGLRRWNRHREEGWRAADAHVHYDRIGPDGDDDWFAMMAGDDIAHSQFHDSQGRHGAPALGHGSSHLESGGKPRMPRERSWREKSIGTECRAIFSCSASAI